MTKVFILIILMTNTKAGGVTSVEFNSLEACERTKTQITEMAKNSWWSPIFAICVAKD